MHVNQPALAGTIMEIVNILRDQQNRPRPLRLQQHQRPMGIIGLNVAGLKALPPGIVKGVDTGRVPSEGLGCGHVLDPHIGPDSAGVAKGIEAGFPGNAGASQDHDRGAARQFHKPARPSAPGFG